MRRELIRIGEDIVNTAFEAPIEIGPAAQIEEAEKALYRVAERGRFGEGPLNFDVALAQAVMSAERALARGGNISGVSTGYTDLDALLGGLHPSDLIIVAGRPGMGKTALATNMAFYAARLWAQGQGRRHGAEARRAGAAVLARNGGLSALRAYSLGADRGRDAQDPHRPFHRFRVGPLRAHRAGAGRPAALYRRHRRHLDRADRRACAPHEAREAYRHDRGRLSAAGRAVLAPLRKPRAGNLRRDQGLQGARQGAVGPGDRALAALARRRQPRRQASRCSRTCANPARSSRTPTS